MVGEEAGRRKLIYLSAGKDLNLVIYSGRRSILLFVGETSA